VVARAKLVLADTVAAIAAGAQEPEMRRLSAQLLDGGAAGPSAVLGSGRRAEPTLAALINGTAGTFLELDEGNQFSRGHPGIHAIPAALARVEAARLTGRDLIAATVLGYEIGARIGMSGKIRPSMHPHGTWGTVGAAVAAAWLGRADAETMIRVINIASTLGLATSRQTMLQGGTVRNTFAGVSGQLGLHAWELARAGFTGERDGLATIWGKVVSESFDPAAMVAELGERWEIARNYFKRHACCRYNHGALDALTTIMAARPNGIPPAEVASVEVATYSLAAELSDQHPTNTLAAKFSVPFAIATTIINRSTGIASFTWDKVRDAAIQELAGRVTVREEPRLTAMMPRFRPAEVTVRLADGTVLTESATTNRGDSEDPYDATELRRKYDELMGRVVDPATADAVHRDIMAVDTLADVGQITRRLDGIGSRQAA
jgi:2-methylcitrate dehydratase PrpD